jgi:hypothetical protein
MGKTMQGFQDFKDIIEKYEAFMTIKEPPSNEKMVVRNHNAYLEE